MKINYPLLILSLTLPATPVLAMDNGSQTSSGGNGAAAPVAPAAPAGPAVGGRGNSEKNTDFNWKNFAGSCGEKIIAGAVGTALTIMINRYFIPSDPNASIITRDKALENTRQHIKDLLQIAATTDNKELAAECRKSAAFGEQLLAQGISFRNNAFSKLCGNNAPQNQSK